MSTNNSPATSNSSPYIFLTPSEAFAAGGWGKASEKPAEKQQNFAGSDEANQFAAESLLDLVNTDVEVLKVTPTPTQSDPLANATLESIVTSPDAVTPLKRINIKRRQPCVPSKTILVLFQLMVSVQKTSVSISFEPSRAEWESKDVNTHLRRASLI